MTEEHAKEVLLPRDLSLELGHPGHGVAVLRFSLQVVALGNGALLETHPLKARRFAQALRSVLRDFELPVQRAQLDVAAGDRRNDRQHHGALALLAGEQARPGRLGCAAQLAPEIQFEAGREIHGIVVDGPAAGQRSVRTRALTRHRDATVDLRKLRGARDAVLRERLIHIGGCDLEVLVVRERRPYQVRQDRILELIPPGDVGDPGCFGGSEAPGGRDLDLGAAVVRTDHAGRQGHCEQQPERAISHARCVPG